MGSDFFSAQYLQSPTRPGGGIFKTAWLRRYEPMNRPAFVRVIQSWDTASKASQLNDYSVCTTWGITKNDDIYLLHVFRGRLDYIDLKLKVVELAEMHGANVVLIEDCASGIQLVQTLRYEGFGKLEAVSAPKMDKEMRCRAITPLVEAGRAYMPSETHWLEAGV